MTDAEVPPLVVDIDGTLTDEDRAVEPRAFRALREWGAPVVVATGKALPYPIALCEFAGIERTVIAENGGVAFVQATDDLVFIGDSEAPRAVAEAFEAAGHDLGWGSHDLVNRWRETEVAVSRESPLAPLRELAGEYDHQVVDTGFAYHVKSEEVSKGRALETVADRLGRDPGEFVAVGDSVNDVSTFEVAGRAIAVANADDAAREAADEVTDAAYGEGFLEAVQRVRA